MTEQYILNRDIERADRAKRIIENPLFEEAFSVIEAEIIEQLKSVPERDQEGRDLLVRLLKLNGKYRSIFTGWIETGKLASIELEKKSMAARLKTALRGI